MSLALQALNTVPTLPAMGGVVTCHVAVWYWAAQEAQSQGLTAVKTDSTTLGNIAALPGAGQTVTIGLAKIGTIDLGVKPLPPLPGPGAVLRWASGATHVAVVVGPDDIAGYNQVGFMTNGIAGRYSIGRRTHLSPAHRVCDILLGSTVVNEAGLRNL